MSSLTGTHLIPPFRSLCLDFANTPIQGRQCLASDQVCLLRIAQHPRQLVLRWHLWCCSNKGAVMRQGSSVTLFVDANAQIIICWGCLTRCRHTLTDSQFAYLACTSFKASKASMATLTLWKFKMESTLRKFQCVIVYTI